MNLNHLRIAAVVAIGSLWVPASSLGQPAPVYDVGIAQTGQVMSCPSGGPYSACHGTMWWHYAVTNKGPNTIPKGVRISVRIEKPEGLRLLYLDTQPKGPTTIQTSRFWQCDQPYGPPGPAPSFLKSVTGPAAPARVVCHFLTDQPIGPGQALRGLRVQSEGGVPDKLCSSVWTFTRVAGAWVRNQYPAPPQGNRSCFSSAPVTNATYDLELTTGVSGLSGPWRTWSPSIINIANGPVPLAPVTSTTQLPVPAAWLGRSGFVYRAYIPPGATLREVAVPRGWQCEIRDVAGQPIGVPMPLAPVPIDGPNPPAFSFPTIAPTGSILTCRYLTGFQMRPLAREGNPYLPAVKFVTSTWPTAAHPHLCSRVEGFHGSGSPLGDNYGHLENNESCIMVSDGSSVNCRYAYACQEPFRSMRGP